MTVTFDPSLNLPALVDPFPDTVLSGYPRLETRPRPSMGNESGAVLIALQVVLDCGEFGRRRASAMGVINKWLAERATFDQALFLARNVLLKYVAHGLAWAIRPHGRDIHTRNDLYQKGLTAIWEEILTWETASPAELFPSLPTVRDYLVIAGIRAALLPDAKDERFELRRKRADLKAEREASGEPDRKPQHRGPRGMSYEDFLKSKERAALKRKKVPDSDASSVAPDQWLIERDTFAKFAKLHSSRLLACKLRADRYGQQEIADFSGVSRNTVQTDLGDIRELEEAGLDPTGNNRAFRLPRLRRRLAWWELRGDTHTAEYRDTKRLLEQLEDGALPGTIDARRFWEGQGTPESHYFEGLDRSPPTAESPEPAGNGMFEDYWQGRLRLPVRSYVVEDGKGEWRFIGGTLDQWSPPPDRVCGPSARCFYAKELDFDRDELTTEQRLRMPVVPREVREVSGDDRLVRALERLGADIRLLRRNAGTHDRSALKRAVKKAGRRLTKLAAKLKTAEERGAAPDGFNEACSEMRRLLASTLAHG